MKKVTLKRPVSDKGYIWESQLWECGFNDLPIEQQFGEIIEDGLYPFRVYWPFVGLETLVCINEVIFEGFDPCGL